MDGKGQYLSLEQMILFSISVIVMVLIYHSFSTLSEEAGDSIVEDQLQEVSEVTMAGIYRTYRSHNNNGEVYKKVEYDIPKEISGDMYKIDIIGGNEMEVYIGGEHSVRRSIGKVAEDINISMKKRFMDGVSSRKGSIEIELKEGEIKIGR